MHPLLNVSLSPRPAPHLGVLAALLLAVLTATASAAPRSTLRAYTGDDELRGALERWRLRAEAQQPRRVASPAAESSGNAAALMSAAPAAPAAAAMGKSAAQDAAASDGITNVQTAGVDEGGIVKRAGDHLVILRRGRLFTVRIGGEALAPVSTVDAYAPGTDPQGAWYDELLVSGSTVVVVGYNYARGGTEIGLFDLRTDGSLSYRATWHLRSFDYFSSRNYASRLVGSRLVFYTPQLLSPWRATLADSMPALRRWRDGGVPAAFERILPATRVYRTDDDFDPAQPLALHTVTACDLATRDLQCESTAVLGPAGRVFYVSAGSVYVWTTQSPRRHAWAPADMAASAQSAVFRLPLDGAAPTALKTAGSPIDPLSFLEDDGGHLNVLLRDSGVGDAMWAAEHPRGGRLALLRVPLDEFGDGRQAAQRAHYRPLPPAPAGALQNRFVGDWLLWGAGGADEAFALRYAAPGGPAPARLLPGHAVERIEALGAHALLVGNRGADLHLSAVRLGGGDAVLAGRHVQPGARQGETRTHGFFYRATGRSDGLLGLPVVAADGGAAPRRQGGASVAFVRQDDLDFTALGQLDARGARRADDACKASCVDWYGNARPIFIDERVFALMGYELVEGRRVGGAWRERLVEHRRIDFTPAPALLGGRHWPFE